MRYNTLLEVQSYFFKVMELFCYRRLVFTEPYTSCSSERTGECSMMFIITVFQDDHKQY